MFFGRSGQTEQEVIVDVPTKRTEAIIALATAIASEARKQGSRAFTEADDIHGSTVLDDDALTEHA